MVPCISAPGSDVKYGMTLFGGRIYALRDGHCLFSSFWGNPVSTGNQGVHLKLPQRPAICPIPSPGIGRAFDFRLFGRPE